MNKWEPRPTEPSTPERIYEYMRQHGSATDSELCAALGLLRVTCRITRQHLMAHNIIAADSPRRFRKDADGHRETFYVLRPLPAGEARKHFV